MVDHMLCSMPFETTLLHSAGVPATFVGHPLLQQLLGSSSSSTQSFGGKARALSGLLKHQQQQQQGGGRDSQQQQQQQQQQQVGSLFAAGNAAFWRQYEAAHALQEQAAAAAAAQAEADAAAAAADHGSSSSSSSSSSTGFFSPQRLVSKRKAPAPAAAAAAPQQLQQRLLLAMLPGTTESEVISSLPAFDQVTQQLRQHYPDLIATLHVPDALIQPASLAVVNFKVPVLVVASGEKLASHALAAAAAAVSHPGTASLQAVSAGVPLLCMQDGSMLRHAWAKWRRGQLLPFDSVPNLLLGREAVPEFKLW
jgi:lipid A disaccharide synthetase